MAKKTPRMTLPQMLGMGSKMEVCGKAFRVMPLTIAHAMEFVHSNVAVGVPLLSMVGEEETKSLARWFGPVTVQYAGTEYTATFLLNDDGTDYSFEEAVRDGWTMKDVRTYLKLLADISD